MEARTEPPDRMTGGPADRRVARREAPVGRLDRRWLAAWALFGLLALLVHSRQLAALDQTALRALAALRPIGLADAMNWIFRLGFVQVDAAIALGWAAALLIRHRLPLAALPPLVLFVAIGVQASLRLVIDQPAPDTTYALDRRFAAHPVGYALDQTDALARQTFSAAVAFQPLEHQARPSAAEAARGSFPSGHATRALLLALLAGRSLRSRALRLIFLGLAGAIGFSALYYGYHWPSDVLGGYLLALAIAPLAGWLQDRVHQRRRPRDEAPNLAPVT